MNKQIAMQDVSIATPARIDAAEVRGADEVWRLRERVERQHRANRTLTRMVRKLLGDKAEARPVAVVSKLRAATLAQHPERRTSGNDDAWWPTGPVAPPMPLAAPVGHDCLSLEDEIEQTIGVSVMGLSGAELEEVVAEIADQQLQQKSFKPVFLTDQHDFMPFVSRGYAFEYLSGFRSYLEADPEGERAERVAALGLKWGLAEIVSRDRTGGPAAPIRWPASPGTMRACRRGVTRTGSNGSSKPCALRWQPSGMMSSRAWRTMC